MLEDRLDKLTAALSIEAAAGLADRIHKQIPRLREMLLFKEITSRQDDTLFLNSATSKVRLPSKRNANLQKEGVA